MIVTKNLLKFSNKVVLVGHTKSLHEITDKIDVQRTKVNCELKRGAEDLIYNVDHAAMKHSAVDA